MLIQELIMACRRWRAKYFSVIHAPAKCIFWVDELFKDMLFLLHGLLEERFEILVYGEGDKGNGTRNCKMV